MIKKLLQKIAEKKAKKSEDVFLKEIRKRICSTTDIHYDDLKNLYDFLQDKKVTMDLGLNPNHKLYGLEFRLIPKNPVDTFGYTFVLRTGGVNISNETTFSILLRSDGKKRILIRKYEEPTVEFTDNAFRTNYSYLTVFEFIDTISFDGFTGIKTPNSKVIVDLLVKDIKRYFAFIFDNYHIV